MLRRCIPAFRLWLVSVLLLALGTELQARGRRVTNHITCPYPCDRTSLTVSPEGLLRWQYGRGWLRLEGPFLPGEVSIQGRVGEDWLSGLVQGRPRPRRIDTATTESTGVPPTSHPSEHLVVVLDPGHGGSEDGAFGLRGYKEKQFTLAVALMARKALADLPGVEVVLTRREEEDVSLLDRGELANQVGADLLISIHANGFTNRSWGGIETFFHSLEASGDEARRVASKENILPEGADAGPRDSVALILQDMQRAETLRASSRLAVLMQERLAEKLGFSNRGVMQADFAVLKVPRMPAILIEVGFITNPDEEKKLRERSFQSQVAQAIVEAVRSYRELLTRQTVEVPK